MVTVRRNSASYSRDALEACGCWTPWKVRALRSACGDRFRDWWGYTTPLVARCNVRPCRSSRNICKTVQSEWSLATYSQTGNICTHPGDATLLAWCAFAPWVSFSSCFFCHFWLKWFNDVGKRRQLCYMLVEPRADLQIGGVVWCRSFGVCFCQRSEKPLRC